MSTKLILLIIAGAIILAALFIIWVIYEMRHAEDVDPNDKTFLD